MSGPHVCQCRECHPDEFPTGPRQNEGHMGTRFGDTQKRGRMLLVDKEVCVHLRGKPYHFDGVEVCPGSKGWIWRTSKPQHPCPCKSGLACEEMLRGAVRLEITEAV